MRILVIEDDMKIASFIVKGLKQAGYAADHILDGQSGLDQAQSVDYDALIVDIMLPRLDGYSLIQRLREKKVFTPCLILSAKSSLDDKLKGFQAGTDDYLTKPFSFSELLARVQALLRRSSQQQQAAVLTAGDLRMDLFTRRVTRGSKEIELQPREYSLLEYLMRNSGNVVSKTMIMEHVWDYHFDPETNVVDVLVHRLRTKIERGFEKKILHTVRGVGYVLKIV
ncbi:MAG: response regulator transcription factor [Spirochaetales bacterium]|nr:response regulator transcription factor [Spirochaetales bacterium]